MTWWQWAIGTVEFVVAFRAADWFLYAHNRPEAVERRRVRYEARTYEIANTVIGDTQRDDLCNTCYAVLWDYSPTGECRRCRLARREASAVPVAREHPDDVMHQMIMLRNAGVLTGNDLIHKEFAKQYRQVMDL